MPEMEVLGADANQQEALFLIDDAPIFISSPVTADGTTPFTMLRP